MPLSFFLGRTPSGDIDKSFETGENRRVRWKRENPNMEIGQVNPIGRADIPPGFQAGRRRYSLAARVVATAVLTLFTVVVIVTTVVSLGSYCLTSDGSNASGLHQGYLRP